MPNPTRFQSIQAVRMRVAQLTSAGAPLTGAGHGYVSDAIVDLTVKVVTEAGEDQSQKNGSGAICATYTTPDTIKRLDLDMTLCQLDTNLIEMLADADPFTASGNPIGWQYPSISDTGGNGVCLEVWSLAWDGGQQAVPAFTSPNGAYFHWVFPLVKMTLGDVKLDATIQTVPLTGKSSENAHVTANGPFDDWPSAVAQQGGVTRCGGVFLDSNIPAATGSKISVSSAAS